MATPAPGLFIPFPPHSTPSMVQRAVDGNPQAEAPIATTLAVGEEGGDPKPAPAPPPPPQVNENTVDFIALLKSIDSNKDSKVSNGEVQEALKTQTQGQEEQKKNLIQQRDQLAQQKQFFEFLNFFFFGLLTPWVQQLSQQQAALTQKIEGLAPPNTGLTILKNHFDTLASADSLYPDGDKATIAERDLLITAWRDGNGANITTKDLELKFIPIQLLQKPPAAPAPAAPAPQEPKKQ